MIRVRKRKPGKRYPCGKRIRQETEREAMATALDARRRHYGVSGERARDERLGTALGRLAFRGKISEKQCQAGLAFADLYRRHHMAMGLPLPSPPSVAAILINEGIFGSSPSEPMLDAIERLKNRFEEATDALDQCDREHALAAGRRPTLLVYRARVRRRGHGVLAVRGLKQLARRAERAGTSVQAVKGVFSTPQEYSRIRGDARCPAASNLLRSNNKTH